MAERAIRQKKSRALSPASCVLVRDFLNCLLSCLLRAFFAAVRWAKSLILLAGVAGLEPATPGFGVMYRAFSYVLFFSVVSSYITEIVAVICIWLKSSALGLPLISKPFVYCRSTVYCVFSPCSHPVSPWRIAP
jgi:hypothetical protein